MKLTRDSGSKLTDQLRILAKKVIDVLRDFLIAPRVWVTIVACSFIKAAIWNHPGALSFSDVMQEVDMGHVELPISRRVLDPVPGDLPAIRTGLSR